MKHSEKWDRIRRYKYEEKITTFLRRSGRNITRVVGKKSLHIQQQEERGPHFYIFSGCKKKLDSRRTCILLPPHPRGH